MWLHPAHWVTGPGHVRASPSAPEVVAVGDVTTEWASLMDAVVQFEVVEVEEAHSRRRLGVGACAADSVDSAGSVDSFDSADIFDVADVADAADAVDVVDVVDIVDVVDAQDLPWL